MEGEAQLKVRLPPDIKKFVEAEAERNGCSQNSEVIRAIRERMERTNKTAPEGAATPTEA